MKYPSKEPDDWIKLLVKHSTVEYDQKMKSPYDYDAIEESSVWIN